jgi:hypothetical protein
MDAQHVTAQELLQFCRRAAANGAEKPAIRRLLSEIETLPAVEERLCFEFLAITRDLLEMNEDPGESIGWVNVLSKSVGQPKLPRLIESLESLLLVCFENLGRIPKDRAGSRPYSLSLVTGLACIRRRSPERFQELFSGLKDRALRSANEAQDTLLRRIER